uniref:28S ribosomal protein S14, mitochondrial-like n=1 Tax=Phallusia mammillata TaxID=59560 RepID=A0A6F9DKM6_9ASCI|nr:28S ribosomal protein S14, mitochondrial-like [Phallusia mammillata]
MLPACINRQLRGFTTTAISLKNKRNKVLKKFGVDFRYIIPKNGPKPPTESTVTYPQTPEHLTPESWVKRGDMTRTKPLLWHCNWVMQRDARRRALGAHYGPVSLRLHALQYNDFLPLMLRQVAHKEYNTLPRASNRFSPTNRCVITSRPRGKKRRWRVSRIVFRHFADHGQMCGVKRAQW